ncbi:MAG TPA: hypothetical protein DDY72_06460 [Verrucomicrobia bacterium]|nr:hypothetical protein [Verrucomicrobiota bacterium]
MQLELNGLAVACIIGDRPYERTLAQTLRVDLALTLDAQAARTDALSDTVDYAALTENVRRTLVSAKCWMIERAAKLVLDVCFAEERVHKARVRLTKAGAVAHLESAAVVLEATRAEWRKGVF